MSQKVEQKRLKKKKKRTAGENRLLREVQHPNKNFGSVSRENQGEEITMQKIIPEHFPETKATDFQNESAL